MKYPNWSQVFENDPNNEAYDKNMETVGNLTIDSISGAECIENIKKENNLMFLSVEPITKEIQLLHHVSAIGGTIAMPTPIIIAISGLGSNALSFALTQTYSHPQMTSVYHRGRTWKASPPQPVSPPPQRPTETWR